MDYKGNNNIPNQNMPNQGMPNPNAQGPGMMNPGMGNPNMGPRGPMNGGPMNGGPMNGGMMNPGMGNPGMGQRGPVNGGPMNGGPMNGGPMNGGMMNPGMGNPNMGPRGPVNGGPMNGSMMGNPDMGRPGVGRPGMGRPSAGRPGPGGPDRDALDGERPGIRAERENKEGTTRAWMPKKPSGAGSGLALEIEKAIGNFAPYIYGAILVICLTAALIAFAGTHKPGTGGKKISVPTEMFTYSGLFRNVYEAAASGNISDSKPGVLYDEDGTMVPAAPTAIGEETPAATDTADNGGGDSQTGDGASGQEDGSDAGTGSSSGNFSQAGSYKELLDQLEKAIASGDTAFVASKMAYEDENGTLKAFPQTVVEHFVTYMSTNSDKRTTLMTDLTNDKYSGQSNGEFIVKLPYIKFVVNMGYDNTTVSLPGFSDQVVNAGQSADIAPLLPCMYTLTISNPDWNDVVTRDIEANINEATISINIKP